ncbi:tRNA (5-methylaminomethyl-2-thiouridine)(34)-methyltransferase MnmD [Tamlana crocina]|uniref:tRNA (5-methylaminomethyl-2-thiouridine)(34)-methyltransferase MnmD n=1 Tax=Tamlana crocina TaxID=393006 RepID=A0ABX1DDA8_9FLAO|nr:tRNA (5-methylaminomethyl-2-thiouridine)(34)-methyltransferase MnmD [Tamlana crocina]NJX16337.1 tRNA (5-methylaminomethyl-2-thiouridine)(34)-methyltransferase MnmD [Tamlana crocina]
MKREIIVTADGSTTIYIPEWNEQYHSKHGAIQEAYHVFIKHGLLYCNERYHSKNVIKPLKNVTSSEVEKSGSDRISILEIGFGTGLNAFFTLLEAEKLQQNINYVGIEAYPVSAEDISKLNYTKELKAENSASIFKKIHDVSWEESHLITDSFSLTKRQQFFSEIDDESSFDLIYFDAFGARVQPELWTEDIFKRMYRALKSNGVLVTYAAKGSVRRAMQSVGFLVEKLPGPPGKREMLRAWKEA